MKLNYHLLGPTGEETCKSDEREEELMEDTVASTSDNTEDCKAEVSKELEDGSNAREPKDDDAVVVPSEGNNPKASKKVHIRMFSSCLFRMFVHCYYF